MGGFREREWDTRVGTVELAIPKLHQGSYFPSLLEPRRRHERALLAVVQEASVHGVSTRNVDALAEALGLEGISKYQVSRICKELDGQVHAFRTRPLSGDYPYLMLDATFEKVRENGRVVTMAVVIAVGMRSSDEREVLGTDVGPAGSRSSASLTSLPAGSLAQVTARLVVILPAPLASTYSMNWTSSFSGRRRLGDRAP